jgi:hypothetical protein
MASLFAGPPPSPAQLEAAAQERAHKEWIADQDRWVRRKLRQRVEELSKIVNSLGAKLAVQPDDDALAKLFHEACDRLHAAELLQESFNNPVLRVLRVSTLPETQTFQTEGAA